MRATLAVVVCVAIFLLSWILVGGVFASLAWVAVRAGQEPGVIFVLHVLMMWILSPGLAAGIAVFATISKFKTVPASTVLVGFVSILGVVLFWVVVSESVSLAEGGSSVGRWAIVVLQSAASLVGANTGRAWADAAAEEDQMI